MDELKNIEYKGIGDGLLIACRRDLSPSASTISLNDDWQTLYSPQDPRCEARSGVSTIKSTIDAELGTKSNEGPSATTQPGSSTNERYSQPTLTPFERYCFHAQAHEQLVVGQITDRRSLARLGELDDSLDAAAKLVAGCTSQFSVSSSSISGSTLDGDPSELGSLLMADSPELQAPPQEEQAKYLHKIAKLKRRLKAEGGPRAMKSARVRKRSKTSNKSTETGDGGMRSLDIS